MEFRCVLCSIEVMVPVGKLADWVVDCLDTSPVTPSLHRKFVANCLVLVEPLHLDTLFAHRMRGKLHVCVKLNTFLGRTDEPLVSVEAFVMGPENRLRFKLDTDIASWMLETLTQKNTAFADVVQSCYLPRASQVNRSEELVRKMMVAWCESSEQVDRIRDATFCGLLENNARVARLRTLESELARIASELLEHVHKLGFAVGHADGTAR